MIGINKLKNNDQSRQLPRTLFLGDLPLLCTDDRLYGLFSPYGRIESIQLKKEEPRDKLFRKNKHVNHSRQDQRHHLSYGFVKFVHHNSAAMALQNLNNIFILGRRIRVCWARDNPGLEYLPIEELESTMQPGGGDKKTAQIHVLYITPIMHATISELDLYEVFRAFGKVVDVSIKKSVINEARQIQSGYGFVHFELSDEGVRSALQAIEVMNHRVINNVTYEVTMTHGLRNHLFYLSSLKDERKSRQSYHNTGSHIIVPDDTSFNLHQSWEGNTSRSTSTSTGISYDQFTLSPKWSDTTTFGLEQSHPISPWNLSDVSRPLDTCIPDRCTRTFFQA